MKCRTCNNEVPVDRDDDQCDTCSPRVELPTREEVLNALSEALSLLRHYAKLLNMHDGGNRIIPKTNIGWILRVGESWQRKGGKQ